MSERLRGTVVWFTRDHGFVAPDGWAEGVELFVHFTELRGQEDAEKKMLYKGQRVEFELGTRKGDSNHRAQANNVFVLESEDNHGTERNFNTSVE